MSKFSSGVTEAVNLKDAFHSQMIYERNCVLFYHIVEKRANNSAQVAKLDGEIRKKLRPLPKSWRQPSSIFE